VVGVAGLDDVVTSKRFADRNKGREALPELERLRDEAHHWSEQPQATSVRAAVAVALANRAG
jgi:hypothetical protein